MSSSPTALPTALSIAGSDPSGGAGIQADLRAFTATGVHGASVIAVVTAQGTRGVRKVAPLAPDLVRAQLEAVLEDLAPRAVKTGALGTEGIVEIVADVLRSQPQMPLVVDPVVNPTRGRSLLDDSGFAALVRELLPLATLVVPNKDEASRLTSRTRGIEDARRACKALCDLGARNVLVKGGHFTGNDAVDLFYDGRDFVEFRSPRLAVPPMHGLGCLLSSLITGYLARGFAVRDAVRLGHLVLHHALQAPARVGEGLAVLSDLRSSVLAVEQELAEAHTLERSSVPPLPEAPPAAATPPEAEH